jgi:cytochrome oxidase Cu insertion factor (SCO1/SenC/PrrC family)
VGKAQLISFTVDPQRDTPQVLAAYGANVGADPRVWRFLTGPNATVQPMLQTGFKVGSALPADSITAGHGTPGSATPAAAGENANHLLVHSSYFVLVDGQGKIRAVYDGELIEATEMLKGIQALLDER